VSVHRLPHDAWPVALVTFLPQWFWLVIPGVLAAISALGGWRWAVAGNLALLVASAQLLAGWVWPTHRAASPSKPVALTVLTWNVHNQFRRVEEVRQTIEALRPDLICLQEARDAAFEQMLPGWDFVDAIGLKLYARPGLHLQAAPVRLRGIPVRPWLAATIRVNGRQVDVLGVHVTTNEDAGGAWRRGESVRAFLCRAAQQRRVQLEAIAGVSFPPHPLVVLGDFKTPPLSPLYRLLQWRLTDCFAARGHGLGLTYVAAGHFPSWRIDYVWCNDGLEPLRCTVGRAGPSDHRPVVAELALR
jgi:endonuclease/exonuclease/phosphatase (EEP) superfamily protein YafD